MIPFNYTEFIDGLTLLVQNGTIPMSRVDDAVRRILRVKFTLGLFENPYADTSLAVELGNVGEFADAAGTHGENVLVHQPGVEQLEPIARIAHAIGDVEQRFAAAHRIGAVRRGVAIRA